MIDISNKQFTVPILLITFNRPNHVQQVFDSIKKQKPKTLFVFQDGERKGNKDDKIKCANVKKIFSEQIDWDCNLITWYSDINLGCGKGPSSAISWFFEQNESGIIIEDDAIPAQDFYQFAEILLELYKNDQEVKAIGSMHMDYRRYSNASYYFTMMNRNLCAWATWKRAWNDFDYHMTDISEKDLIRAMKKYKCTSKEISFWCERLNEIHINCLNESSWDMQFLMSIWLHHGKGIYPNVNLATNIGFDSEGTHTVDMNSPIANVETKSILPFVHISEFEKKINRKSDLNFHKLFIEPEAYGMEGLRRLPFRWNKKLKKILGHEGSWIKTKNK